MNHRDALNDAMRAVSQRADEYGTPEQCFEDIAFRWQAQVGVRVTAIDVAVMMIELKLARLKHNPGHWDSWVDIAGYAACAAEISSLQSEQNSNTKSAE